LQEMGNPGVLLTFCLLIFNLHFTRNPKIEMISGS